MQRQHDNDHLAMLAEFLTAMEQPVSQGWEDLEGIKLGLKPVSYTHLTLPTNSRV